MTRKIDKKNITGLTQEKKEILKSLEGAVKSSIDLNKMREEMEEDEPYCTIQESIIESCNEVKLMREDKNPKNNFRICGRN